MEVIIKNTSVNELFFEDIGVGIKPNEMRNLGILFKIYELKSSYDLMEEVEKDNVIINDGTKYLTKSQALSFFIV